MYKDMNYFCYGKIGYAKLSLNDKKDIFREFLLSFCPDAFSVYKELYNMGNIFYTELDFDEIGESFILQEHGEFFMGLCSSFSNDLLELETYIHELMHIYSHRFLKNYHPNQEANTFNGFFLETIPLYSELEFYRFMIDNHIFVNDMYLHANFLDYVSLTNYKTMKYLSVMLDREDADVYFGYITYKVLGNNILEIDKGVPYYQFSDKYKDGKLNDFVYGLSMLDAYDLQLKKLNGEKNVINNYLISLQDQDRFHNMMNEDRDLTFMRDSINEHLEGVKRIYLEKK